MISVLRQFFQWDVKNLCNVTDRGETGVVVVPELNAVYCGYGVVAFPGELGLTML